MEHQRMGQVVIGRWPTRKLGFDTFLKRCLWVGVEQDHGRLFVLAKTVVNSHLPLGPTRTLFVVVPLDITKGIAYFYTGQYPYDGIFVSTRHDSRYAVSESRNGAQRPYPFSAN